MMACFRAPAEARKLAKSTYDRHHTSLSVVSPGTPHIAGMIGLCGVAGGAAYNGAHIRFGWYVAIDAVRDRSRPLVGLCQGSVATFVLTRDKRRASLAMT